MKDNFLQSEATTKPRWPVGPKRVCFLVLALSVGVAVPALAQQQPVPAPAPVAAPIAPQALKLDPKVLLRLVRSTLDALDQANKTGNYSVLRDLSAPDFQRDNSLAKMSDIFAVQRQAGLDLSGALVLEPTITLPPQVEGNGLLHLAGYFLANTGAHLNFELMFQMVDNKLLIYGVSVNVSPVDAAPRANPPAVQAPAVPPVPTPAAPAPAATPAPTAAPEAAKPNLTTDPAKAQPKPRHKQKHRPGSEQPAQ